jgi:hypothetical protein
MLAALRATGLTGVLLLGGAASAGGCDAGRGGAAQGASAKSERLSAAPSKATAPESGAVVSFEATTTKAGSLPGAVGRDPGREADLVPVELKAFEIDRAPFPNEPGRPAAHVDHARAIAECAGLGKRLCHELEWEHACNQAPAATFASTAEWVLSSSGDGGLAGARGGGEPKRCGARAMVDKTSSLAFRCCGGSDQAAPYPAPALSRDEALGAKPLELSVDAIRKALSGVPSLAALAPAFQPFSASDADAALRKGKRTRDGITAWAFLPSVIAWTPASADELVIVAGRSGEQALIAALYPLGDGTYAHAASAVLREPDATVAIASSTAAPSPRELLWTSCYGCPNEGGTIRYGDDRRVVIEFR